ncbi:MAG: DUF1699 family protein [Methanotrichaceae archaeon]
MRLAIVSSKEDISTINQNEQIIHLAFRPSNMDVMKLISQYPRLRAIQIPPSYYRTMSKASRQFLEIQGIALLKGDIWGHRKDIDEYYYVDDTIIERISSLVKEGYSVEKTINQIGKEAKLSEDLIKYILKERVRI